MPKVIGGKLKLKGIKSSISNNKKKNRSKSNDDDIEIGNNNEKITNNDNKDKKKDDDDNDDDMLTKTERKHKEILKKKMLESISKSDDLGYRNRLNKFNEKLATQTEHNDIPRVSAAGNG